VSTVQVSCRPNLLWRISPSSGELIRYQSNHDIYVCSHGGVDMSGGDKMDISSRVRVVRRVWEPMVASCLVWI
jgi:hypothetical protein